MNGGSPKPIVSLPVFEGPLDLLLQLIEQQRLDITAIALARVADQYLAAVRAAERIPADLAEFLVIGAKLILIKTRALLPRPPVENLRLTEEDVGDQLACQLRDYSRLKQVVAALREREASGLRTHVRLAAPPVPLRQPQAETFPRFDVGLRDLVGAVERRLKLLQSAVDPPVAVPRPKTLTIAEVTAELHGRLVTYAFVTFDDLLGLALTRNEVIVTLWTVLELFKRHVITIDQASLFDQITIGRGPAFSGEPPRIDE